jgi:hypothetical protein
MRFDVVYIDDWRGESISLALNGNVVWSRRHVSDRIHYHRSTNTTSFLGCGSDEFPDETFFVDVVIPLSLAYDSLAEASTHSLNVSFHTSLPRADPDLRTGDDGNVRGSDQSSWGVLVHSMELRVGERRNAELMLFPASTIAEAVATTQAVNGVASLVVDQDWRRLPSVGQCDKNLDCDNLAQASESSDVDHSFGHDLDYQIDAAMSKTIHVYTRDKMSPNVYQRRETMVTPESTRGGGGGTETGCLYCSSLPRTTAGCDADDKCVWRTIRYPSTTPHAGTCRPSSSCGLSPNTACSCDDQVPADVFSYDKFVSDRIVVVVDLGSERKVDSVELHLRDLPSTFHSLKIHGTSRYDVGKHHHLAEESDLPPISWNQVPLSTGDKRCRTGYVPLSDGNDVISEVSDLWNGTYDDVSGVASMYCEMEVRFVVLTMACRATVSDGNDCIFSASRIAVNVVGEKIGERLGRVGTSLILEEPSRLSPVVPVHNPSASSLDRRLVETMDTIRIQAGSKNQPIVVTLEDAAMLTQISTRLDEEGGEGGGQHPNRLETFTLHTSVDGTNWLPVESDGGGSSEGSVRTFHHGDASDRATCSSSIRSRCATARSSNPPVKEDLACYPMALDSQSSCPFRQGSGSPCFDPRCVAGGQTAGCLPAITDDCAAEIAAKKIAADHVLDPACSPNFNVGAVCDYRTGSAASSPFSPLCRDVDCAKNPLTLACRSMVLAHCKTEAGKTDPGCNFQLFDDSTKDNLLASSCSFSFSAADSPCHRLSCRASQTPMGDTSCRAYVRDWCKSNPSDAGCVSITRPSNIDVDLVCPFDEDANQVSS